MTPDVYDLGSVSGVRQIVAALFQGYNYRLYTEGQTRNQLLDAYRQLAVIRQRLPSNADYDQWMTAVRAELDGAGNDLAWWLLGLTNKTAQNLGIHREERLGYLEEIAQHVKEARYILRRCNANDLGRGCNPDHTGFTKVVRWENAGRGLSACWTHYPGFGRRRRFLAQYAA